MAQSAALWTTTLVVAQALIVCDSSLHLPAINLRTGFRQDPRKFAERWPTPPLMDGRLPVLGDATDLTVHSKNGSTQWVDLLYPFQSEKDFDGYPSIVASRNVWWLSYVAALLYLIGLWAGISSMKDKQPYALRGPLALWNLFLAVFSFVGMLRILPHLCLMYWTHGFEYTLCRAASSSYGSGAAGLWVCLFIFSKYGELLDTAFLVLRKRKVGFLHWYHHCTVLLYCWNAYVWEMPTGIYFVAMNFSVHAIMYFYYFLAAVCKSPPKWGLLVTILQLLQMAVGIAITVIHLRILISGSVQHCDGHIPNLTAALGMYASYFILFFQFFVQRYCKKRSDFSKPPRPHVALGEEVAMKKVE